MNASELSTEVVDVTEVAEIEEVMMAPRRHENAAMAIEVEGEAEGEGDRTAARPRSRPNDDHLAGPAFGGRWGGPGRLWSAEKGIAPYSCGIAFGGQCRFPARRMPSIQPSPLRASGHLYAMLRC